MRHVQKKTIKANTRKTLEYNKSKSRPLNHTEPSPIFPTPGFEMVYLKCMELWGAGLNFPYTIVELLISLLQLETGM